MNSQLFCVLSQIPPPPPVCRLSSPRIRSALKHRQNSNDLLKPIPGFQVQLKSLSQSLTSGVVLCSANLTPSRKLSFRVDAIGRSDDAFRGKSGSVSFGGLNHQSVEENQLVSAPFKENAGSLLWVLAPVALILGFVVPQFFISSVIEDIFKNETFAEILCSLCNETIFYVGLATFLLVTDRIQRPYLQFSPRRWSLITGLRGYLQSAFFIMGFKVIAPLFAAYVTWPVLRASALVSVAPFLVGCLVQYVFEKRLESNGSSCWPLVPIIFEVYRIYQLTRATGYMEKLIYGMRDATVTPEVLNRTEALISMIVTFRVLGVVCLWSLLTFLLRLFPSRPVAENY